MKEHANYISSHAPVNDELLQRIVAGDRTAFHQLYEAVAKNLYGFALSITRHPQDAEDVVQETLLTVYRHAPSYQGRGKPLAWIFTIAKNCALRHLRQKRPTIPIEEVWDLEGNGLAELEAVEQRLLLRSLLCTLSEQEQQIVLLHAVEGMKNREIAQILNLPLNTVLSKYHRAIKKLRTQTKGMEE